MIEADFSSSGGKMSLTVMGHAGYAPAGYDIVCAGVSSLCGALLLQLEALEKRGELSGLDFRLGSGFFSCRMTEKGEIPSAKMALEQTCKGFKLIEKVYPGYVKCTSTVC